MNDGQGLLIRSAVEGSAVEAPDFSPGARVQDPRLITRKDGGLSALVESIDGRRCHQG